MQLNRLAAVSGLFTQHGFRKFIPHNGAFVPSSTHKERWSTINFCVSGIGQISIANRDLLPRNYPILVFTNMTELHLSPVYAQINTRSTKTRLDRLIEQHTLTQHDGQLLLAGLLLIDIELRQDPFVKTDHVSPDEVRLICSVDRLQDLNEGLFTSKFISATDFILLRAGISLLAVELAGDDVAERSLLSSAD